MSIRVVGWTEVFWCGMLDGSVYSCGRLDGSVLVW